jgi:phage head maturation protease
MFRVALSKGSTGSFTNRFASEAFKQSDDVNADVRGGIGS